MSNVAPAFLSVGIDIGADFSFMAMALPSQQLIGKPYRIVHGSQKSLNGAIEQIRMAAQQHHLPVRVFMESTGVYHFPMYHKLRDAELDTFVLNPLVTHAGKDINIRNIHNDKFDAQKIALIGLRPDLKTSLVPSDNVAAMKAVLREYHVMKKETSMYICRLRNQLRQAFPQFLPVFSKVNGLTAMAVLYEYGTPQSMLSAGTDGIAAFMKSFVKKGPLHIQQKAEQLMQAAQAANEFGRACEASTVTASIL